MNALVELEQDARLHLAEDRWPDRCADRPRSSCSPCGTTSGMADTTDQEAVR
jgi:hypothetical protein